MGSDKPHSKGPMIDVNKKIRLVRSLNDISENGNAGIQNHLKPPAVQKKRINIPIGDVTPDPE